MKGFNVIGDWIEYDGERFAKVTNCSVMDRCKWSLENLVDIENFECGDCRENSHLIYNDKDMDHAKKDATEKEFERACRIIEELGKTEALDSDDVEIIIDALCG